MDMEELEHRLATILPLGNKGTTTQASFLKLFEGDHKVRDLENVSARRSVSINRLP